MTENQIRAALIRYGFSVAKAFEIALDHTRGDEWAAKWVALATRGGR